jgi:transcriptional regulator with XRE-family HTH domain
MGHSGRRKPGKLGIKLCEIRKGLGLSQAELSTKLSEEKYPLYKADISNFESGKREPSLIVLLRYARLANILVDTLVDDELELPSKFTKR